LEENLHPINLGAAMCADSAHKTLPVLTGGAYLHIAENYANFIPAAYKYFGIFASTSPSYLILQSLDRANLYLSADYKVRLACLARRVDELKRALSDLGFELIGDEALKLTVSPKSYGYTGDEIAELMRNDHIICEMADPDFVVMMFTPEINDQDIASILSAFSKIERRAAITDKSPVPCRSDRVMSIREAMLASSVEIKTECAMGEILSSASVACPPAVPILIAGERIDENAQKCFQYYGIDKVRVVRQ
jgi:arginine/lysine/ornithine decarboxylase